jgi:Ca2+-transporting ATPase
VVAVASLAAGAGAAWLGTDAPTAVFLTLGLAQLGVALALRAPRSRGAWRERGLEAAVLVAGAFQLAGVAVPGLRDLLGTAPLSPAGLALAVSLAVVPGLVVAVTRHRHDRDAAAVR